MRSFPVCSAGMRRHISSMAFVFIFMNTQAQQGVVPLEYFFTREVERSVSSVDSMKHTGFKPYLKSDFNLSKVTGYAKDSAKYYQLIGTLVLRDHLIEVKDPDFHFSIDPLLDLSYGYDIADTSNYKDSIRLYNNIRGILLQGEIGKQVAFSTGFYECQSFFPRYLRDITNDLGAVPGMGRKKPFKMGGSDYSMSFGVVTYSPTNNLNFQIGYGKHFVGHGYRSLLLSDAAYTYPYIESTLKFLGGKLRYSTFYASLQTLDRLPTGETPEALFKRKGGSFHYLSWTPLPRVEIGFFEGTVWQRWDSTGVKPLQWNAYIPVIGLSTAINGFDSRNNVLAGIDIQIKATNHASIYGQFALDDPLSRRYGWQVGLNYFDLLLRNLDLQFELNNTSDHMYASRYEIQSYSHFNQPLGVPYGSGASEWMGRLSYRYGRVIIRLKYNAIRQTSGLAGTWQTNPELVDTSAFGIPDRTIGQWDAQLGLYLNPKTNLQLLVGLTDRLDGETARIPNLHTSWIYFGLRTNLHNRYADF